MGPGLYRKKPVTIEAWQYPSMPIDAPGMQEQVDAIVAWCGGRQTNSAYSKVNIAIDTLEGTMYARPGWWIIKGVEGEFYACKPEIFSATYEQVNKA